MAAVLSGLAAFGAGIIYSSFFEWMLHKHIMHSRRFLTYPYRAHQLEHHAIFRADASYFLSEAIHTAEARRHLTFAWWSAPLLLSLHAPLYAALYFLGGAWAMAGFLAAMLSYYALYESLHFCMHVPRNRWLERTPWFRFVREHHRLHHVYYQKNLNVVLPLADFVFGTRIGKRAGLVEKLEEVRLRRAARAGGPELDSREDRTPHAGGS